MNPPEYSHLSEHIVSLMKTDEDTRIEAVQKPKWIAYSRAKEAIEKLEDLLHYPKTHRMPNMLLIGHTNNGKTMLVKRFVKEHPAFDNPDGDSITIPVLTVQAPPVPDEARFYNNIMDSVYCPYRKSASVGEKQTLVLELCRDINLKMLIIDEAHHILAGPLNKQRQFLNVLKFLGNELKIPLVAVGTRDALRAMQTDQQMSNRFEPFALPRWTLDLEFLKLLATFEELLPLKKPSGLATVEMAPKLLEMSEGIIGELATLLEKAAIYAIRTGGEQIDRRVLAAIDWVAPSQRRKAAEKLVN